MTGTLSHHEGTKITKKVYGARSAQLSSLRVLRAFVVQSRSEVE
jgi:hypothetical protein